MTKDYWIHLTDGQKQSERKRFNYTMQKIEEGGGTVVETDPVFTRSAAHDIVSDDVNRLHNTSDPLVKSTEMDTRLRDVINAINALP